MWGGRAYERAPIDGVDTKYSRLFRAETGAVIVNKIWARNGSVAVVPEELSGCYGSGEFQMFMPIRPRLDPRWMHWLTQTPSFWNQCDEKSRGTSGKNRIRPERFLKITISLPPLEEQRRIVARIEELAAQINEARTLHFQCEKEMEKLLISMAHRPDIDENRKRNEGWKYIRLAEILHLAADSHTVERNKNYPNLGIYSFGRGLFRKPAIDGALTSANALFRVRKGQFIYSRLFAFEGAYGMVSDDYDAFFVSNEFPTFNCDPLMVRAEFLAAYFKAPAVWKEVASGSKGIGDRRQRVHPSQILAYQLWLPPIEWQNSIAKVQAEIKTRKSVCDETATELNALLPSILDKAFKGEL